MFETVAQAGCQYVIGHIRETPQTMVGLAEYDDVIAEATVEIQGRCAAAVAAGIKSESIVVDPGLGFAKSADHNWGLIRHLPKLSRLGHPLMVGASRKRFLGELLPADATVADRDFPSAVLSAIFALEGVAAVRVHNVASTQTALNIVDRIKG
jgi:dihydropteroate synthase